MGTSPRPSASAGITSGAAPSRMPEMRSRSPSRPSARAQAVSAAEAVSQARGSTREDYMGGGAGASGRKSAPAAGEQVGAGRLEDVAHGGIATGRLRRRRQRQNADQLAVIADDR